MKESKPEWRVIIDLLATVDPLLLNKISRRMIYYLSTRNVSEIINLTIDWDHTAGIEKSSQWLYTNMPHPKKDLAALRTFVDKVFELAGRTFSDEAISDQITLWLAQERCRFLSLTVESCDRPLGEIADALNRFYSIPQKDRKVSHDEFINIRVSLIRRFLSEDLRYINVAKNFITVRHFHKLLKNVIGPPGGIGKLGGKSAGIILGNAILERKKKEYPELNNVKVPRSWYITSDTITDFIHYNGLEELISVKYMNIEEIRTVYPFIQQLFKNSLFTSDIEHKLQFIIDHIGNKPIIVRSSSLLEDRFGTTFSGKYKSLFLPNTGTENERLAKLKDAIAEIFASVFAADPIEYRKERGLLDFNEGMGILIQEVVGNRVGKYVFPLYAGVSFSNNEFRWSPRIERKDGAVRIVMGLGTRAVDRLADDYPCLASPGKPGLRVNTDPDDVIRYSQRQMDVLNLESNKFETVWIKDILKMYNDNIPNLDNIISIYKDHHLYAPMGIISHYDPEDAIITFQGLFDKSDFLKTMNTILHILEGELGTPVDVEFASDGKTLYFLQCRPQGVGGELEKVIIPTEIMDDSILISVNKYITSGFISGIDCLVYVAPESYAQLSDPEKMKNVAQTVSALNKILPKKKFILIGPGRWGSRGDIKLGVPITYSDINNTAALLEVAYSKGGYTPDLSFGTHFFQDLVESYIHYIPIYPDKENIFRKDILESAKNHLHDLLPDFSDMAHVVKVVYISDLMESGSLSLYMDGEQDKAVAIIEKK